MCHVSSPAAESSSSAETHTKERGEGESRPFFFHFFSHIQKKKTQSRPREPLGVCPSVEPFFAAHFSLSAVCMAKQGMVKLELMSR